MHEVLNVEAWSRVFNIDETNNLHKSKIILSMWKNNIGVYKRYNAKNNVRYMEKKVQKLH